MANNHSPSLAKSLVATLCGFISEAASYTVIIRSGEHPYKLKHMRVHVSSYIATSINTQLQLTAARITFVKVVCSCLINLIQNSQAVKKKYDPQKGYGEKRCEIQPRNGCDGRLMVKILITTIQVNFGAAWSIGTKFT